MPQFQCFTQNACITTLFHKKQFFFQAKPRYLKKNEGLSQRLQDFTSKLSILLEHVNVFFLF